MKKLLKKSNKGFSLVELIVVIAIMAVLVGIIAPAFLKYVQKSKTSADDANVDALRKAAVTVLADPTLTGVKSGGTFVVKNKTEGLEQVCDVDDTVTGNDGNFKTLMDAAMGGEDSYPVLKDSSKQIVLTISGSVEAGYTVKAELKSIKTSSQSGNSQQSNS